jgi:flagellar biosynthesis repressor protein FlbT
MHISLRAGEKLYINGAVLRVDRKVSLELLNDATFLLEAHVMRVEEANTPLRQLYFIVQVILMNPGDAAAAHEMFNESVRRTTETFDQEEVVNGLRNVAQLVQMNRIFEALKNIRSLFPIEADIMNGMIVSPNQAA